MTKRNCLKVLVMLGLALLAICIFNPNTVNAAEITPEYLKNLADMLPDEMSIDIPEIEYEKADDIVVQKIKDIFSENNVDMEGVYVGILGNDCIYLGVDYFHEFTVLLGNDDSSICDNSKTIKITYSNTNDYNAADAQAVKNLKLETPEYFTYDIYDGVEGLTTASGVGISQMIFKEMASYYQNQVNDDTYKFVASGGAWGDGLTQWGIEGLCVGVFKNGILYEVRPIEALTICKLTIPSNIEKTEKAYIDYATPIITKAINDTHNLGLETVTLTKGATLAGVTIENGYTINGGDLGQIVLEAETVNNVNKQDSKTGIKLETTTDIVPNGTQLIVSEITTGNEYVLVENSLKDTVSKIAIYDISLQSNGVDIQPNGKVKISIPIPNDFDTNKIVVYRIDENGTKTEYTVKVLDNYAIFETDHFSTYVLAEKANIEDNTQTEEPQDEQKQDTTNEHIKDETPKTGNTNIATIVCSILSVLSAAGIAIVKKF